MCKDLEQELSYWQKQLAKPNIDTVEVLKHIREVERKLGIKPSTEMKPVIDDLDKELEK